MDEQPPEDGAAREDRADPVREIPDPFAHRGATDGPLTGRLLVSTPGLTDPHFHRTVVLICAHDVNGAFGLIINRPLEADLVDHLPEWRHRAASPPRVFEGGPVQREVALALGRAGLDHAGAPPSDAWTEVAGTVGIVDLSRPPEDLDAVEEVRVFSGYAGWGGGQLEGEIEQEGWFVVDAEAGDAFSREPLRLWSEVLRRQPGGLAMFATFPADPTQN